MTAGYSERVTGVLPSRAATPGPCRKSIAYSNRNKKAVSRFLQIQLIVSRAVSYTRQFYIMASLCVLSIRKEENYDSPDNFIE